MALTSVLITGGSGFVGSAIARALVEKHPECVVTILDKNPPGPTHVVPSQASFFAVDLTSPKEVQEIFRRIRPVVVIHTAGIVPPLRERFGRAMQDLVWKTNVEATRYTLESAKEAGAKAFVFTSSCCAITDDMRVPYPYIDERWQTPRSSLIYGESKAAAEVMVLEASTSTMPTCALRPSVLCGPGDYQLVPAIHACIAKGETPYIIGDGLNLWDVTYVTNVADAHVLAAENLVSSKTGAGEAFFIQNNEPIPFRAFCLAIWAHFGHMPSFEVHIPVVLAWMAGLLSEFSTWVTGAATTLSRGSVRDASSVRYASGEKARQILGYEARVGIVDGIRLSCEDYARRLSIELSSQEKESQR